MQSRVRGHASLIFYTGADSRLVDQAIYLSRSRKHAQFLLQNGNFISQIVFDSCASGCLKCLGQADEKDKQLAFKGYD
jgi:hypothetical protein